MVRGSAAYAEGQCEKFATRGSCFVLFRARLTEQPYRRRQRRKPPMRQDGRPAADGTLRPVGGSGSSGARGCFRAFPFPRLREPRVRVHGVEFRFFDFPGTGDMHGAPDLV